MKTKLTSAQKIDETERFTREWLAHVCNPSPSGKWDGPFIEKECDLREKMNKAEEALSKDEKKELAKRFMGLYG